MKRLAIAAVGLALVVGATTACRSSGYSKAEVESTVAAAQTARVDLAGSGNWTADGSAWAADVGMAYFQTREIPYKLFRVSATDLSYTSYTAPSTDYAYSDGAVVTGGYLYLAYGISPYNHSLLATFPTNWDLTGDGQVTLYDLGTYGTIDSIDTDGTYLYAGTMNRRLLKIRISDMTLVATASLSGEGYSAVHSIRVDDTHVFFHQMNLIGRALKSDLSGVTYSAVLAGVMLSDDTAMTPDYVYFTVDAPAEGKIYKVAKSDLAITVVQCGTATAVGDGIVEEPGGAYVWAGFVTTSGGGVLARVKVSDDSYQRFWLADDENHVNEIFMAPDVNTILVAIGTTNSLSVVKLTDLVRKP